MLGSLIVASLQWLKQRAVIILVSWRKARPQSNAENPNLGVVV